MIFLWSDPDPKPDPDNLIASGSDRIRNTGYLYRVCEISITVSGEMEESMYHQLSIRFWEKPGERFTML